MKLLFVNAVDQHHGRHNMNVRTTAEGHCSPFATLVVGGPPGGVRMPSGSASQTPLRGEATSCQKGAVSGQTLFTAAYNCIQSLNEARPASYPKCSKWFPHVSRLATNHNSINQCGPPEAESHLAADPARSPRTATEGRRPCRGSPWQGVRPCWPQRAPRWSRWVTLLVAASETGIIA
jgi:hypothetical protein